MPSEQFDLAAHGESFDARLTVPEQPDGRGVAVMPGAGHGPWGDIFDRFAAEAAATGSHVLRFEGWPTRDVLDRKTLRDLHAELDAAVDRLREAGCSEFAVVGKSFGGGATLTHVPDAVDRVVLWAPATFTYGDEDRIDDIRETPFEELVETPEKRTFSDETLGGVHASVRIIVGTEDRALSVEQARNTVAVLDDADLILREGEDHSFRGDDREREVVEQTLAFL